MRSSMFTAPFILVSFYTDILRMDSAVKISDEPLRVILWAVPRSLSTVFEKCISFFPETQIINEPFSCAYHTGPERILEEIVSKEDEERYLQEMADIQIDLPMAFDSDQCTYEFVKSLQEADYPGKQLVFCKDMAYGLQGKYELLPKGYRHTFLIRNPYRAFPSHKKIFAGWMEGFVGTKEFRLCDMPPAWMPKNYGVQEQYELMTYLQEHGEPDPIIVDADDLLKNPASVLRQYCALLGIPFSEERLEWPAGLDVIKTWKGAREFLAGNLHETGGYYDTALKSTRFIPPKDMPRREDLTEDILKCVDHSMPYYEKMHKLRIKP